MMYQRIYSFLAFLLVIIPTTGSGTFSAAESSAVSSIMPLDMSILVLSTGYRYLKYFFFVVNLRTLIVYAI